MSFNSDPLIRARDISKVYEVDAGAGSLSRGVSGRVAAKGKIALHPVNIDVHPGESIGVFGRNGAGKSTLLSLLSRAILPSGGTLETRGVMAPLLQLTAWLDMEETGRANVEAFAAINGLVGRRRRVLVETAEDFADIGKFFDAPVRTYSSGMVARLAFGAAFNVSADIMLIDEIIAVGDSGFRARCHAALRRKVDSGSSLIIVSQSPGAVMNVVNRGIVLENGHVVFDGDIQKASDSYSDILRSTQKSGGRTLELFDGLSVSDRTQPSGERALKVRIEGLEPEAMLDVSASFTHHRNIDIGSVEARVQVDKAGVLRAHIPVSPYLTTGTYLLSFDVQNVLKAKRIKHYPRAFRLDIAHRGAAIGIADLNFRLRLD